MVAENNVEVGGAIKTLEGTTARYIEIGKRGEVQGIIRADHVHVGRYARVGDIFGRKIILGSGAQADNIYGENVVIESDCQISGDIQYINELKMGENVSLSKQPQKVSTLPQ